MRRIVPVAFVMVACLAGIACVSRAAISVSNPTLSAGGAESSSTTFVLLSTLGEPLAGFANGGAVSVHAGFIPCLEALASLDVADAERPALTRFRRVSPNPSASRTSIAFDVAAPAHTTVRIYDAMGRWTRTLIDGRLEPGRYDIEWDGTGQRGARVGAGIYYLLFQSGETNETRKLVLLN